MIIQNLETALGSVPKGLKLMFRDKRRRLVTAE